MSTRILSPAACAFVVLLLAPIAAGCRDTARGPYVIEIDVGDDVRALGSDDLDVSGPAADRLAALGPAALPALRQALRDGDPVVRIGVVEVLQGMSGGDATSLLIDAASDGDAAVRADALLSLGLRAEPSGRAVVEAALADGDPRARGAAAAACHTLCRSPGALERLVDLALTNEQRAVAQRSLNAVLNGGDEAGRDAAGAAIRGRALPLLADTGVDDDRRFAAAQIAALAGRREALPVLIPRLASEARADRRTDAALALGHLDDAAAVAALARAAAAPDPGTRNAACIALGYQRQRGVAGAEQAAAACP